MVRRMTTSDAARAPRHMAPVEEQMRVLMSGTEFGDEPTRRTMERELRERLAEDRPLRVYCGYDPTKADLHLGHTLTMRKLRQFQEFGHQAVFLIGNFTGLVGDPSEKNKERPMLSAEDLAANARTYAQQAFRILDGESTEVRYNADWLSLLTFADVVRLCSKFTIAQFLERDNFAKRFERGDAIHLSEFMYAIMQAYDAVVLETDVQVGGSEQLFNLMAGRTLQRDSGQRPQVVLTLPILVGTDGHERMSKTTGNYIGIDERPNDVFGKVMSIPDTAILDYFTLATPVGPDAVDDLRARLAGEQLRPMDAKKRLAREITASLFDAAAAEAAQDYFESTIQRKEIPDELPEYAVGAPAPLHRVLVDAGVVASGGEVRRLVAQGAVAVNGQAVSEFSADVAAGDVVRVGKHRFVRLVEAGDAR
ncbi:MAG: tyrosine--tRNA ligase [Dehalococcoidia bacterium]|nr:tyrosine--tRNA ligase [Dehalococcoidia bacterium]